MTEYASLKPVAILGSGPAALVAAHAVGLRGFPFGIISRGEKSQLSGAQFLHEPIPDHCTADPERVITYKVTGDAETYKQKVYGALPANLQPGKVSFENVWDGKVQGVWDLKRVYDELWEAMERSIEGNAVESISYDWVEENHTNFRAVINTIPRLNLCKCWSAPGTYIQERVWIDPRPPDFLEDGIVWYNGDKSPSWSRASRIGGVGGVEYGPNSPAPPGVERVAITKPISTTCKCLEDKVIHVGRYGKWKKGELVHNAFQDAWRACDAML